MSGNTLGTLFRLTTFGESHGEAIGGVIDGCPPGLLIDEAFIQQQLDRRKPGTSGLVSSRKESDTVHFVSGIFEGKTTGVPIAFFIANKNARTSDYAHLKNAFRPSHADFTYYKKYTHTDYRGGGRSSARETAARVVGGSIAMLLLKKYKIDIAAYTSQIGHIAYSVHPEKVKLNSRKNNIMYCPDEKTALSMEKLIRETRKKGDSIGGKITCIIRNTPPGLGEPVFDKLHAELGKAMLSINAARGFEYGSGFAAASMHGSEHNDLFYTDKKGSIRTRTNHSGGIQGGISNGEPIYFSVAFKPVATIMQAQQSVNKAGNPVIIPARGRHDPCVVPRAVVIVECMAALTLADFFLRQQAVSLA